MLVRWDFIHTLEIITHTLSEVVNSERLCGTIVFYFGCFRNLWGPLGSGGKLVLFACSLGFRRTLKITVRTLRDVVTRVSLFACSLGFFRTLKITNRESMLVCFVSCLVAWLREFHLNLYTLEIVVPL